MKRSMLYAAGLASALLLTGCGGDPAPAGTIPPSANATTSATGAPPTSTTTATSPPTTSTPTTPTGPEGLPAAAKQRTEAGGVAFVKRYWEVFNETATTPRVGILPTYSLPTCKTCVNYEERRRNLIKYDVRYDRALNTNGDAEPVCGAGYADPCAADPSLGPGPATAIWGRELSPSTGQPLSTVWARLGVTCLPSAIPSGVRLPVSMVVNAFHRTPWAKATISTQPKGNVTLVNLKTFYQANWQPTEFQPGEVQSIPPAQMLGFRVYVRPKLANYVYHYGDGEASEPTDSPGGVYPDGDITHTYRQRGAYAASVEVTFGADYRVDGGAWQPLPGQATVTMPGTTVTVREARAVLANE